jgi:hypothetical protein
MKLLIIRPACYGMLHRPGKDSSERPKELKTGKSYGTCNVRNQYRAGSLKVVARELKK